MSSQPPPKKEAYHYAASSYRVKSHEEELFELVQLSGVPLSKDVFKVIYELLKLNVAPSAILEMVQTMSVNSPALGDNEGARSASLPPSHSTDIPATSTHKAPPTVVSGNSPVQEGKQARQHSKRHSKPHRDRK